MNMVNITGQVTRLLLLREWNLESWDRLLTKYVRTLICIPVGGELLPTIGSTGFVTFFGGMLVLSLASFVMARWACLEYRWKWNVKI